MVNTKGTKGDIGPELKEAIVYLDRGEVTGPYSKELDDAVRELKSSEERGQEFMKLSMFAMEQRLAGEDIKTVGAIRRWLDYEQEVPKTAQAKILDIPVHVFDGVLDLIEAHPDWDDETVADQAGWG